MPTAQSLLARFNRIKTLPHVEIRLTKLLNDGDSSLKDFETVIRHDPTLVLRVLHLVNSSYYGLQQKIESISRAVVFIGVKNLRNMITSEALKAIFEKSTDSELFSRTRLWLHSVGVGICSQMISERLYGKNGEDAFLCGILHDIGMIVEDQVVQDAFLTALTAAGSNGGSIVTREREAIGTDHCRVGSALAREWRLPCGVGTAILHHHAHMHRVAPSDLTGIVQTAEYIISKMGYAPLKGMPPHLSPPLAVHIRENISEYRTLAKDIPGEMEKAREIYEMEEGRGE